MIPLHLTFGQSISLPAWPYQHWVLPSLWGANMLTSRHSMPLLCFLLQINELSLGLLLLPLVGLVNVSQFLGHWLSTHKPKSNVWTSSGWGSVSPKQFCLSWYQLCSEHHSSACPLSFWIPQSPENNLPHDIWRAGASFTSWVANEALTHLICGPTADAGESFVYDCPWRTWPWMSPNCLVHNKSQWKIALDRLIPSWFPCHLFVVSFISSFPLRESPWPWRLLCFLSESALPLLWNEGVFLLPRDLSASRNHRCPRSLQPRLLSFISVGKGSLQSTLSFFPFSHQSKSKQ